VTSGRLDSRWLLTERLPYRIMAAEFQPTRGPGLTESNDMLKDGWFNANRRLIAPVEEVIDSDTPRYTKAERHADLRSACGLLNLSAARYNRVTERGAL
jgi:hypothetical protein